MSTRNIETNAIIIGAGPAGASTSIFLSKSGIKHVVIEKEVFPRDKVCGDGCSGKTAFVLRAADPAWLEEVYAMSDTFMPSYGIKFVAPNGKGIDIPYKPNWKPDDKPPGFTVPRLKLDNFLFKKINPTYATVLQSTTVKSIDELPDKVVVTVVQNGEEFTIEAPAIVGCDGDKSMVRKKFMPAHVTPKTSAVGLRAYYHGVTGMHEHNFLELHFLPEVLPGYLWIFPLPNGQANVGIGMTSKEVRTKKVNLRETMLKALAENPNMKERFGNATLDEKILGWGLPMCTDKVPVSGNRFILTGDAATLIDPFSGEGIGNALFSGKLAAAAIEKGLEEKDFSAAFLLKNYDDVLFKKIGGELKISAAMQRLCKFPMVI